MGIRMGLTMEVEIMSKEYIRPSSPTPPHLKNTLYKFSLLDHLMPPVYVPMVLLYPPTPPAAASADQKPSLMRSQTLKQSLSETLTRFYPLAGRISRDNLSIDCNDEGAYFIEASVDFSLSEFVEHPQEHLSFLPKLVPPVASSLEYDFTTDSGSGGAAVVMIQLTNFSCGGFVIGALVSHMIVDGIAMSTFLKSWAAATSAHAETAIAVPNFDSPLIFAPNPNGAVHPREATMRGLYRQFVKQGRSVTTRFVFDASAVAKLKDKAATTSIIPSRVEAISAFIWKCAIAAWNVKGAKRPRPSLITHAVNMRRRAVPPFSEYSMGNFVCLAPAIHAPQEEEDEELELSSLVRKMREATTKMDGDVVRQLQGEQGLTTVTKLFQDMSTSISSVVAAAAAIDGDDHHKNTGGGKMDFIGFTSIAYSGVYDADFGWGKPMWVIPVHEIDHQPFYVNVVRLMDRGQQGNGSFEAWVSLGEEEIALLERNEELLAFASLNPSPLPPPVAAPLSNSTSTPPA